MKKAVAMALSLCMVAGVLAACGTKKAEEKTGSSKKEETTSSTGSVPSGEKAADDTLVVGTTDLNGDFINGFTNSSYDVYGRRLMGLYGNYYATYITDEGGEFQLDTSAMAKDPEIKTNDDGSKTYRFFLKDGLLWSDGQPITAKDYVFANLFEASKEWMDTGAGSASGSGLKGYKEYHEGTSKTFEGMKLVDDKTFELTIAAENLPYFFEKQYVAISPYPMHRFAPNVEIGADGRSLAVKEGYTVSDADKKNLVDLYKKAIEETAKNTEAEVAALEEQKKADTDGKTGEELEKLNKEYDGEIAKVKTAGDETKKALEAKIANVDDVAAKDAASLLLAAGSQDVAQNYRFAPDVVCGPYKFVSFKNQIASFTINDKFGGDREGKKPQIKNVVIKKVNQNIDVDLAVSGEIDIVAGVVEGEKIEKAKKAESTDVISYSRNGYGQIRFLNDLGATKHKEVRRAVAYLLDRDQFVQNVLGGYGVVVNASYGLSEWTYQAKGEELEEGLTQYALNVEKANEELDKTPYVFEKDGTTKWDAAKAKEAFEKNKEAFDYWRYDDKGNKLQIDHYASANNPVSDTIAGQLPNNGKQAGLFYNIQFGDFATMLELLKKPDTENPKFTAFNMAVSFSIPNDPWYQYHSSQIGNDNQNRVNDPKLDEVLDSMRKLDAKDRDAYLTKWVEFQKWYNENVPELPLYSNEYYDVFNVRLHGLKTTPVWDWSNDILDLSISK